MRFDRIALENQKYVATRAERTRHSEHWILKIESGWSSAAVKSKTRLCSSEKENARDDTTNIWQRPSRNIEPFLEANK